MLNKINLIISREYYTRVRKKSFIVISILGPLGMLLLMLVPTLLQYAGSETTNHIAIIDECNTYYKCLESTDDVIFERLENVDADSMKNNFIANNYHGYLHITGSPDIAGNVTLYSENTLSLTLQNTITNNLNKALQTKYMDEYKGNKAEVDSLINKLNSTQAKLTTFNINNEGIEQETSASTSMALSIVASMIIYFVVLLYGNMVMTGVIEEKRNRIIEVLISSVSAFELMMGKIIGIALVALTQFAIWFILGGTLSLLVSLFLQPAQSADAMPTTDIAPLLQSLTFIDFNTLFICFILYFIFGYLQYASLYAWIGSTMDNPSDSQQLSLIATLPLCIAFYIALYVMNDPESSIVWWSSMIPITSPIVMIARLPFGVDTWEIVMSLAILVVSFVFSTWIAARIYRATILMYGKNISLKQVIKYLKQQ